MRRTPILGTTTHTKRPSMRYFSPIVVDRLPEEIAVKTREKYVEAWERVTDEEFEPWEATPVGDGVHAVGR